MVREQRSFYHTVVLKKPHYGALSRLCFPVFHLSLRQCRASLGHRAPHLVERQREARECIRWDVSRLNQHHRTCKDFVSFGLDPDQRIDALGRPGALKEITEPARKTPPTQT